MTWEDARLWCQHKGGDLASPVDVEELMVAVREISKYPPYFSFDELMM